MFPDFQELLGLLNKNKVKYLVIGGYAVSRHAQPRVTKDLDILIQPCRRRGITTGATGDIAVAASNANAKHSVARRGRTKPAR